MTLPPTRCAGATQHRGLISSGLRLTRPQALCMGGERCPVSVLSGAGPPQPDYHQGDPAGRHACHASVMPACPPPHFCSCTCCDISVDMVTSGTTQGLAGRHCTSCCCCCRCRCRFIAAWSACTSAAEQSAARGTESEKPGQNICSCLIHHAKWQPASAVGPPTEDAAAARQTCTSGGKHPTTCASGGKHPTHMRVPAHLAPAPQQSDPSCSAPLQQKQSPAGLPGGRTTNSWVSRWKHKAARSSPLQLPGLHALPAAPHLLPETPKSSPELLLHTYPTGRLPAACPAAPAPGQQHPQVPKQVDGKNNVS